MKYLEQLIQDAQKALITFPIKQLIVENVEDVKDVKQGIYIIEEIEGDKEKTFKDFLEYKKEKFRSMPAANQPSDILYVGSSVSNIKYRLLQHLGKGARQTYALHLNCWFNGKVRIKVLEYDTTPEILQLIEDSIAFDLQPAFGKRGSNGK